MAERVYAGRSAEQRVALRREQFLAAGLEIFARQGWSGSSVADVCRSAGLSPRFFYELFDSREALFLAVTAGIAARVEQTVRDAVATPATGPEERARAVLVALAGHFATDPRTVRVALMESLATEQFRHQRRELLELFSDLAARLMWALRDDAPDAPTRQRLRTSAAVLTGGLVELLVAHATAPAANDNGGADPARLVDHLTAMYTAVARL